MKALLPGPPPRGREDDGTGLSLLFNSHQNAVERKSLQMECSLPLFLGGGPGWGALLCLLLLSGCGPREPVAKKPAATEVSAPAPAPTIASAEKPAARAETLSLLGSVRSAGQAALSVRMPARIVAVNVREDDTVRKGQLLIVLDAQEIAAQRSTAEAGLQAALAQLRKAQVGRSAQKIKADADVANAQAGLKQAQAKAQQAVLARDAARDDARNELVTAQEGVRKARLGLERAQETLRGLEELAKVGGVSRNDLEGARAQVAVAQSDLQTAQAGVRRLEAGPEGSSASYRVALAQKDVETAQAGVRQAQAGVQAALEGRQQALAVADQDVRAAEAAVAQARAGIAGAKAAESLARLVSPLDGIATDVNAHVGETAQPGLPLVTVTSLSGLRVEALVPARQLPRLRVGQAARITLDAQPGRVFPALVSEIARVAEPDGRTFRVRFRFQDKNVTVRPGQTARITVRER